MYKREKYKDIRSTANPADDQQASCLLEHLRAPKEVRYVALTEIPWSKKVNEMIMHFCK